MYTDYILSACFVAYMLCTKVHARLTVADRLLITPPGPRSASLDSNLLLICSLNNYQPQTETSEIRWKSPKGEWITQTFGRTFVEDDGFGGVKLFIRQLQIDEVGTYTCEATVDGETYSVKTVITITEPLTFDESPNFVQHELGSSPLLSCTATGQSQPQISWIFKDGRVPKDTAKYTQEEGGLRIHNVDLSDNGTYECRAEVPAEGALEIKYITLDVLHAPIIVRGPTTMTAIKGTMVTLTCEAHGNPDVTYEWSREKKMSDMVKVKVPLPETSDTYVFRSVSKDNEGRYICKVSNSLGIQEAHADLTVLVPPKVEELQPKVVVEGSTIIMACRASGVPRPTITWGRAGSIEHFPDGIQPHDPRMTVRRTKSGVKKLVIDEVQRSYSGLFTCTAQSDAGKASRNQSLIVHYKPVVNMTSEDQTGMAGQTVNFTCIGYGLPLPSVNWFYESRYISNNGRYNIVVTKTQHRVVSILQIAIVTGVHTVFGSYSCTAKNQHGLDTASVTLTEARLPEAPHNIKIGNLSPFAVTLENKQSNDDSDVTSWKVDCEREDGKDKKKTFSFDKGENMTVEGLEAGVDYMIHLRAVNRIGYGESVKFRVRTPKLVANEQSDVPRVPTDRRRNHTLHSSKQDKLLKKTIGKKRATPTDGGKLPAIVAGIMICIIAALLVLVVGLILWRRKRSKRYGTNAEAGHPEGANGIGKPGENVPMTVNYKNRPLPDIVHAKAGSKHNSPHLSARSRENIACCATTPNSIQKQAWEQMLQKQHSQSEEEEPLPETSSITSLPPPPSFLLDEDEEDDDMDDAASYQDIIDGYHSEDNLDDVESAKKVTVVST